MASTTAYISPVFDTTISSDQPNQSFLHETEFSVGWDNSLKTLRTLLKFDVTFLGKLTATSAVLTLYPSRPSNFGSSALVRRITQINLDDSATWNRYDEDNTWTTAGGDLSAAGISWTLPTTDAPVNINITSFVNDAVNNRSGQLLLVLLRNTENTVEDVADFYSMDIDDPYYYNNPNDPDPYLNQDGPILRITYQTIEAGDSGEQVFPVQVFATPSSGPAGISEDTSSSFGTRNVRNDAGGVKMRSTTIADPNQKRNAVITSPTHVDTTNNVIVNNTVGSLDVTVSEDNKTITNNKVGSLNVTEIKTRKGVTIINNQ